MKYVGLVILASKPLLLYALLFFVIVGCDTTQNYYNGTIITKKYVKDNDCFIVTEDDIVISCQLYVYRSIKIGGKYDIGYNHDLIDGHAFIVKLKPTNQRGHNGQLQD